MKTKIITILTLLILLFSCGPKEITDCDYKLVAEQALENEARHIWNEYNGEILYLAAHTLNKNESLELLELEDYHKDLEDYSQTRKAIENGYPVIELYYNFNGYSKRAYGGNTIGTYWHYEGNYTGTAYRFWEDYKSCPCDGNRGSSGLRWKYPYSTFFGLTPLFRNLLYNPDNYDTKWELKDIRNIYKDFTQEMIFEYETDTTSEYKNTDWSKWKTLNDSKFLKIVKRFDNSYYSINLKSNAEERDKESTDLDKENNIIETDPIEILIVQTNLNVRVGEDVNSDKLIMLNQYDTVQVISKGIEDIIDGNSDFWYQIKINDNLTGYVFGHYTNLKMKEGGVFGIINDPDGYTNVRKEKSSKSEILFQIYEDEKFIIQNNDGDWWLIEYSGKQGYIHNSRISVIN